MGTYSMLSVRFRLSFLTTRFCSTKTPAELRMTQLLKDKIAGVTDVEVNDVSSGCGSMYSVFVESTSFKGLSKVAQHKMITGILKDEIKDMHGLSITTKVPK
ncbi:hypothetical protein KIN20_019802 [Parelaphostrongylus tenuis]|uniref:Bola-like protein n=1 Tax=Parelaphostrongylus tenuis TaxID=148309 RepID=A0AAD5MLJ4_PARTN|nr:hypothetical protein KIN20_019802 [Parelaphostrongylus tenuis]